MTRTLAAACSAVLRNRSLDVDLSTTRELYAAAVRHGVTPLVLPLLLAEVDAATADELRRCERATRARTLRQMTHLRDLVRLFEGAGLRVVALKGPALAAQLYGDPTRRASVDLDFLLRAGDVRAASQLMQEHGLAPSASAISLRDRRRYDNQIQVESTNGVLVELQWQWAEPHLAVRSSVEDTLRRSVPVDLGGATVRALHPADLLAYLALHGAKHGWCRLDLVCDYAAAAQKFGEYDTDARAIAREYGLLRALEVAGRIANGVLGMELPVRGRDARADGIAQIHVDALLAGRTLNATRTYLHGRDNLRDRWRSLALLALNPSSSDRRWLQIPAPLFPLYYVARPLRLATVGVQRALQLLQ